MRVRNETIDFAFVQKSNKPLDASIQLRPLFRSALAICARKGLTLNHARSLVELSGADWLATGNLWVPGATAEVLFRVAGLVPPRIIIHSRSHIAAISPLANRDMSFLTQPHILDRLSTIEILQEIVVAEVMPSVTVGLYPRTDTPPRVAAAMARHVITVARELARA